MSLTVKIVFSGIVALVQAKDGSVDVLLPGDNTGLHAKHHVSPHRAFLLVDPDDIAAGCGKEACPAPQFTIAAPSCLAGAFELAQTGFSIENQQISIPAGALPKELVALRCGEQLDLKSDPGSQPCAGAPGYLLAQDHRWVLSATHWGSKENVVKDECLVDKIDPNGPCPLNARFHFAAGLLSTTELSTGSWDFTTLDHLDQVIGKGVRFARNFAITLNYPDESEFALSRRPLNSAGAPEQWLTLRPSSGLADRHLEIWIENAPIEDFVPRSCDEQQAEVQLPLIHSLLYQSLAKDTALGEYPYPIPTKKNTTSITWRNPPACEPVFALSRPQ